MPDLPWYRYFPADFDSATRTWTNEEVGVYIRLLNHQWLEGGIPDDEERRERIAPGCASVWVHVSQKFTKGEHGMLLNRRLEKERQRLRDRSAAMSKRGKKGAEARWSDAYANGTSNATSNGTSNATSNGTSNACANAQAMLGDSYSESESDTEEEKKKNTRLPARGARWKIESYTLPDGVPDDDLTLGALQAWLDYRKAARQKPYTSNRWIDGAWKRCGESRGALLAAVENSLEHEYQGIYPASSTSKQSQSMPDEELTPAERVARFGSLY